MRLKLERIDSAETISWCTAYGVAIIDELCLSYEGHASGESRSPGGFFRRLLLGDIYRWEAPVLVVPGFVEGMAITFKLCFRIAIIGRINDRNAGLFNP